MLFGFYNKFVKFQSNILRCFPDIKIKKIFLLIYVIMNLYIKHINDIKYKENLCF
jgi:hypothetical protein